MSMRHREIMGAPRFYVWGFAANHNRAWEHYMHVIIDRDRNKAIGEFFEYCLN